MNVEEESVAKTNLEFEELIEIVENNDVEGLKAAFELEAFDVNMANGLRKTALHHAVISDKTEILELLTSHPKINLNAKDFLSKTPLITAAEFGKVRALQILLKKGADASSDGQNTSALWLAAMTQKRECIEALLRTKNCFPKNYGSLSNMSNNVFDEVKEKLGRSIMWRGCFIGSLDTVKFLIERNVLDLNIKNAFRQYLQVALEGSFLEIADYLIQKGASLTGKDYFGKTAYDYAAKYDESETFLEKYKPDGEIFIDLFKPLVQFSRCKILKSYAAICIEKYPNGLDIVKDVISFAFEKEKEGPLESLLCLITDKDFIIQLKTKAMTAKNPKMFVPLYARFLELETKKIPIRKLRHSLFVSAMKAKNSFVCDYLLEQGVDPKGLEDGKSFLIMACQLDIKGLVESLLKRGADANRLSRNRESALYHATANNNSENVRILLEYGADYHFKDDQGCTPLLISAYEGYPDVFFELFKVDKDLSQRSIYQMTPFLTACQSGNVQIIEALIEADACLTDVDECNWNCLHFAAENQNACELMVILHRKLGKSAFNAMMTAIDANGDRHVDIIFRSKDKTEISEFLLAIPDLAEIISAPIFVKIEKSSQEICLICRDGFEDNDCAILLSCKHVYHEDCYNEWSRAQEICPYCQRPTFTIKQ